MLSLLKHLPPSLVGVNPSSHTLHDPSFFLTKMIGEEKGLLLGCIMPSSSIPYTNFSISAF